MSYGTGRERKKRLRKLEEITNLNIKDFLRLAADQYTNDYANMINNRASERETQIDSQFLNAVAKTNFINAFEAFQRDVGNNITDIIKNIIKKQTNIDYDNNISDDIKRYFLTSSARNYFFEAARIGIRKILENPLKMGLSRTVLQKYLQ
ncbi:MAG: hypothetical protein M0Q13_05755 [Methanothrix sp.]|jgi:hypothetical protein|nr:hypothetical protein [Methanothrix sp.]